VLNGVVTAGAFEGAHSRKGVDLYLVSEIVPGTQTFELRNPKDMK
jgi:hypothetical protein